MEKLPAKITEIGKSTLRIIKSVGPLVISQSIRASDSYAEHQLKMAKVEAARQFMLDEVKSFADIRNSLRTRFYDANPEERIRLKRDIEETEREIRRLNIFTKALDHLPSPEIDETKSESVTDADIDGSSISAHWMDKFNEYARAQNEDWRQELLAKALALEAQKPGFVGPRALWVIGTIDDYLFHAFASLLDASTNIGGDVLIIPNHLSFNDKPIPNCILGPKITIGALTFMLSDLGLIGDTLTAQTVIDENAKFLALYGKKVTEVRLKKKLTISGIIPTSLGATLAKLYTPIPNNLGLEIYNKWLESLGESVADKKIIA